MKPPPLSLLAALAGFAAGFPLSKAFRSESVPVPVPAKSELGSRDGKSPKAEPGTRMQMLAEKAATLEDSEWPQFFRAQLDSPEASRLVARLWAESDPAGFWKWLKEGRDSLMIGRFANDLVRSWAASDPDKAMDALMDVTDKELGDELRRTAVDTVLDRDLAKGIEMAARAGDFNRFSWSPTEWMKKDPAAAVKGLATLKGDGDYRYYLNYALPIWVESDPSAALEWMKSQSARRGEEWMTAGFKAAGTSDFRAALEAARSMNDPVQREAALGGVLASGKVPADELQAVLAELPLAQQGRVGISMFGSASPKSSADLATGAALFEALPASSNNLFALESFARQWSSIDPTGGWQWAAALPDPTMRRRALVQMVSSGNPEQLNAVAGLPFTDLSDELFRRALGQLPPDQRDSWISSLPASHAAWAKSVRDKSSSGS